MYFENCIIRNFAYYYYSIYVLEENSIAWECNIHVRTINTQNKYD